MTQLRLQLGMPIEESCSHRDALEARYSSLLHERLDIGRQVTYVPNKQEAIYGWYRYKEAFSRRLVTRLLVSEWALPKGSLVFDPFAGCGTTLLAAQQCGFQAAGVDVMPLAVFVAGVKLLRDHELPELEQASNWLLSQPYSPTGREWPKVRIIDLAFDKDTQQRVLFYRELIQSIQAPAVRDFLMLALLASLEPASRTSKDGQFLRLISRPPRPICEVLAAQLRRMLADLWGVPVIDAPSARIFQGDARSLPQGVAEYAGEVSAIVTSPPYLNRYDYSRTYALELCLMYDESGQSCVKEFEDLKSIRHSLLRSHIESRPAPTDAVRLPSLEEILANLRTKSLNNSRIPIMIKGYFEDMNLVLAEMSRILKPGGVVGLVVANARFEGEMIPVDLMLSEMAATHGMQTAEIRVTRYKGNSSQQMGRYGRVPVRESIVFWRKRNDAGQSAREPA